MTTRSPSAQRHADWIGMLQPEGLVVSVPVLDELDLYVRQPQEAVVAFREATPNDELAELGTLAGLLGWPERHLLDAPDDLRLDLPDLQATLAPTHVVTNRRKDTVLLVEWHNNADVKHLDRAPSEATWSATHTERFERLLTHTEHPVGLQVTPSLIRLIYAPSGQAPGRLTFHVADLCTPDGRLLVDALHMLLGKTRLIAPPRNKSLLDVLVASRSRQEEVTDQLARQVQDALEVLLAGIDTADERTNGALLRDVSGDQLYDGLITMLLRMVFLLYAEDRGLMPVGHAVYAEHYAVAALGEQLARDAVAHGEAQTRRFGSWARLISLSRMVWSGAAHGTMNLPPRQGGLFHPDRAPFLEGRPPGSSHTTDAVSLPPVDDAVVHGVLDRLLHLDGQRISYRNLEVEQLGSVYEALMGFEIHRAATPAMALKIGSKTTCWVELGELAEHAQPYLHLQDVTGERNAKLRKKVPALGKVAVTGDPEVDRPAFAAALSELADSNRALLPARRHYLQPGAERRNSGSHYTPRALTEPLVRRTLAPLLAEAPTPEHILGLRICDPAMGSGAFLAEVVRQLADALVAAWARTGTTPPSNHDPVLVARRKVAERCVYGVDKNPRAVMLARLSLWLITSSADLPFTFVDHNLKPGDALVGLSFEQVTAFSYSPSKKKQEDLQTSRMQDAMRRAAADRADIIADQRKMVFSRDEHRRKTSSLKRADDEVWDERRVADLLVACAWDYGKKTTLNKRLSAMKDLVWQWYPNHDRSPMPEVAEALLGALPMRPFHWWLEFPEVFGRKNPGFDAVVGNPPFGGKNTIVAQNGDPYIKWLQQKWPHAHGNADLCSYFFLRSNEVVRKAGWLSLVASNTIKQGNTLDTGLRHLVTEQDLTLVAAENDYKWPVKGVAVVVDRITATRQDWPGPFLLDGEEVDGVNSELNPGPELPEPVSLLAASGRLFEGAKVYGSGFIIPPAKAESLIAEQPSRSEVLKPYIGGRELNNNLPPDAVSAVQHDRYVIDFGESSQEEARGYPILLAQVEKLVKPERDQLKDNPDGRRRKRYWWQFGRVTSSLNTLLDQHSESLCCARVAKHLLWSFQPSTRVFSDKVDVLPGATITDFAVLQSMTHSAWAWAQGSSLKTDLSYSPTRCFETFPFPRPTPKQADALARTGEALYTARHQYMVDEQVGMTETWNRLHDPHNHEPAIERLRALRDAMDRAVLDAYGWPEVDPDDSVEIVARLRKLNAKRAKEEAQAAAEAGKKKGGR